MFTGVESAPLILRQFTYFYWKQFCGRNAIALRALLRFVTRFFCCWGGINVGGGGGGGSPLEKLAAIRIADGFSAAEEFLRVKWVSCLV